MTVSLAQFAVDLVPPTPQAKVSRTELTPHSFLRRSAAIFPDKTAVVHGNRGISYDYRTLAERVDRLASALGAYDRWMTFCRIQGSQRTCGGGGKGTDGPSGGVAN